MIVKNSLITLVLLATITACGSDKKSYRHTHTNPDVVSPDKVVQVLETTKEEVKPEVKVEEAKPETKTEVEAPATPVPAEPTKEESKPEDVKPEEKKALEILGSWVSCKDSDDSSDLVVQTLNDKGEINFQHKLFKGQGCSVVYTAEEIETIKQDQIEASKDKTGKSDPEGVDQAESVARIMKGINATWHYEVTSVDAQIFHITILATVKINLLYSIDGNKLTFGLPNAEKKVYIRQ